MLIDSTDGFIFLVLNVSIQIDKKVSHFTSHYTNLKVFIWLKKNSLIFLNIQWIYQFPFGLLCLSFFFVFVYCVWVGKISDVHVVFSIATFVVRTVRHIILPTFSRALKAIYIFLSTHLNSALFAKYWKIGFRIVSAFSFAGASIDKLSCLCCCCCCCTLYGFRKQKNIEETYCLFLLRIDFCE